MKHFPADSVINAANNRGRWSAVNIIIILPVKTMKANKYLYSITAFLMLLTWLWVGIKKDDEFGELSLFLKYKPSLKVTTYRLIKFSSK